MKLKAFPNPKDYKTLAMTVGMVLYSAMCSAQSVAVYGDSVSVTLTEAGTLRETLIDHDVSFNTVKQLRLAGPFNSEELKFFVEKKSNDYEILRPQGRPHRNQFQHARDSYRPA